MTKYKKGSSISYAQLICLVNAWVVPMKDKKGVSLVNAFKKIISEERKPNKIWVDQGSKFYKNSLKDFLKISNIEMNSIYNEGKSAVAERFIRT